MMLDGVDLLTRRITVNGHSRRLDDITAALVDRYLADRQRRWPHILNGHLFLSEQTGHDQRPVSEWWLDKPLRGLKVTLNRSAWTARSKRPSTMAPMPCTWPSSSASVNEPRCATRTPRVNSCALTSSNNPIPAPEIRHPCVNDHAFDRECPVLGDQSPQLVRQPTDDPDRFRDQLTQLEPTRDLLDHHQQILTDHHHGS